MKHLNFLCHIVLVYCLYMVEGTSSGVLGGIHLPLRKLMDDEHLNLNGAGVRSINIFGWNLDIYVAGFYTRSCYEHSEQVFEGLDQSHAMQFDFTFLRSVGQSRVTEAWQRQLAHSVDHTYENYETDRDMFIAMFGPIKTQGTETVILKGNQTIVVDQGIEKGSISGKDFQKAFLSMWFGNNAVAPDLKDGFLGNHRFERVVA